MLVIERQKKTAPLYVLLQYIYNIGRSLNALHSLTQDGGGHSLSHRWSLIPLDHIRPQKGGCAALLLSPASRICATLHSL